MSHEEDNNVIKQAKENSTSALKKVIDNFDGGNSLALAKDILEAIQKSEVPNVKYDIF